MNENGSLFGIIIAQIESGSKFIFSVISNDAPLILVISFDQFQLFILPLSSHAVNGIAFC